MKNVSLHLGGSSVIKATRVRSQFDLVSSLHSSVIQWWHYRSEPQYTSDSGLLSSTSDECKNCIRYLPEVISSRVNMIYNLSLLRINVSYYIHVTWHDHMYITFLKWFHFAVFLLHNSCPVTEVTDRLLFLLWLTVSLSPLSRCPPNDLQQFSLISVQTSGRYIYCIYLVFCVDGSEWRCGWDRERVLSVTLYLSCRRRCKEC